MTEPWEDDDDCLDGDDGAGPYYRSERPACTDCGRDTAYDSCEQCGVPLCPMCWELCAGYHCR